MKKEEIVEWDVETWNRVFDYWKDIGRKKSINKCIGLELGSRNGGTTLFFVKEFGVEIFCTDLGFPTLKAKELHSKYDIQESISYFDVDATSIPFDDNKFDFVIFKSMLGTIGSYGNYENIKKSMSEIHRVLKPGGVLFFAENLQASKIHSFARRKFVRWGKRWYYVSFTEMKELLMYYSDFEIKSTGFFSAFIPSEFKKIKFIFSKIDMYLEFLPNSWKYVSYGHAIK